MGLFNIHTRQWETSILAYLSIEEEQLPKVAPSTFIFPALAPSWQEMLGVEEETVLVLGGADGPLSNRFGSARNGCSDFDRWYERRTSVYCRRTFCIRKVKRFVSL